jgi:L-lactate dehydrogenase (cytochrome)
MSVITCVDDLKVLYKRRVPRMFYDYAESGSWTEQTFRDNVSDFSRIRLRQKVAVNMEGRSTASQMVGQDVSMPVALAPVGLAGMQCADGEIKAAKAAEAFGVPFTLSTMSICSIEDVAENTTKPFWFQLYVMKDRGFVGRLIDRAKAAGCSALMLTLDMQIGGQRHKDLKNGLGVPVKLTLKNALDIACKPRWAIAMAGTRRHRFDNVIGHVDGVENIAKLSDWTASQYDPTLSWEDIKWIRDRWSGPLILKGILDPDDAKRALNTGADAIIVSNHGGRQLDGAMSAIRMLPEIVDAVGDKIEVHMDSGIRTGQDVLKALALGAKGTYIGRSYIYGLGAMGQAGVTAVLNIIHKEFDTTMALCGRRNIAELDRDNLLLPKSFRDDWA